MTGDDLAQVSLIAFRDFPDFSGPILREDGRLAVCNRGKGFCIRLSPDQLREFGRKALVVAALLDERERAAADEAGAELARITAGTANG